MPFIHSKAGVCVCVCVCVCVRACVCLYFTRQGDSQFSAQVEGLVMMSIGACDDWHRGLWYYA